ncbi:hypothetical protein RJT34_21908 [Clitoria ternatea]|uniref:MLO-like protein n=1 Tax=Clitoria ternatea TaxID=43366 RepID=A0AAN9IUQ3_CLITE
MSGGGVEEGNSLEFTPTWVVAVVCSVIVAVSFAAERFLHYGGKFLKKKNQKPLYEALLKIKEELMLLGFISLFLTVTQNGIIKICVPVGWTHHMLPCKLEDKENQESKTPTSHFQTSFSFSDTLRHLLAESESGKEAEIGYCAAKGKAPLLSVEAVHHLHIFIFVLAIVHVTFCVLTVVFGGLKIRQWKYWEDSIGDESLEAGQGGLEPTVTHVHQHAFIRDRFTGFGKDSTVLGWVKSFFKQFYGSVTKLDYVTLRLGFIMTHCRGNPRFNFHKYMIRALEDDFKKVVGISWYLWFFVIIFMLLNVHGWHAYFWISFIPVIVTYHFDSCIMGRVRYLVPRLIFGVFIQVLCSYSTLPLYAIVTQMGTNFKKAIFDDQLQARLVGWAQKAKKKGVRGDNNHYVQGSSHAGIQIGTVFKRASAPEDNNIIVPRNEE